MLLVSHFVLLAGVVHTAFNVATLLQHVMQTVDLSAWVLPGVALHGALFLAWLPCALLWMKWCIDFFDTQHVDSATATPIRLAVHTWSSSAPASFCMLCRVSSPLHMNLPDDTECFQIPKDADAADTSVLMPRFVAAAHRLPRTVLVTPHATRPVADNVTHAVLQKPSDVASRHLTARVWFPHHTAADMDAVFDAAPANTVVMYVPRLTEVADAVADFHRRHTDPSRLPYFTWSPPQDAKWWVAPTSAHLQSLLGAERGRFVKDEANADLVFLDPGAPIAPPSHLREIGEPGVAAALDVCRRDGKCLVLRRRGNLPRMMYV